MAICEDAPCCGCCGRDLYGNDAWAQSEPDYDPYDDDFREDDDWDVCDECDRSDDCECEIGVFPIREDFGWAGMTE